jgi:hypothetical protein
MKHPSSNELHDCRRGELPVERALEIESHLRECASCRREWQDLQSMESRLEAWEDRPVPPDFTDRTMRALERDLGGWTGETVVGRNRRPLLRLWVRRIATAAAVVGATLLFQAGVWSPLPTTANIQAVFALAPSAVAEPADQAVPDSVLVLTAHPEHKYSVGFLEGTFTIEELVDRLEGRSDLVRYKSVKVVGADPDEPVTIHDEEFDPLLELLGSSSLTFGEGVMRFITIRDLNARVSGRVTHIEVKPRVAVLLADSTRSYIKIDIAGHDSTIVTRGVATLRGRDFEIITERDPESGRVRLVPRIHVEIREDPDAETLRRMESPDELVIAITESGDLVIDHAVITTDDLSSILEGLRKRNPDLSLKVIMREGDAELVAESEIVTIANREGITRIVVKRVKKKEKPPRQE